LLADLGFASTGAGASSAPSGGGGGGASLDLSSLFAWVGDPLPGAPLPPNSRAASWSRSVQQRIAASAAQDAADDAAAKPAGQLEAWLKKNQGYLRLGAGALLLVLVLKRRGGK
jgi:hypothetical protein